MTCQSAGCPLTDFVIGRTIAVDVLKPVAPEVVVEAGASFPHQLESANSVTTSMVSTVM